MHDPNIVAFEIKYPWWKSKPWPKGVASYGQMTLRQQRRRSPHWKEGYRETFITIWHRDPERDGSDDSCGWSRNKKKERDPRFVALIEDIKKFDCRADSDWQQLFQKSARIPHPNFPALQWINFGDAYCITYAMLWQIANRDGNRKWFDKHGVQAAHNLVYSTIDSIASCSSLFGMIDCIASHYARKTRPWWKHPRWHLWHWRIQCHPLQLLKRCLFDRCAICGGRFKYGETVCGNWEGNAIWHPRCDRVIQVPQSSEVSVQPVPSTPGAAVTDSK